MRFIIRQESKEIITQIGKSCMPYPWRSMLRCASYVLTYASIISLANHVLSMSALLNLPWEIREQIYVLALQRDCPLRRPKVDTVYEVNKPVRWVEETLIDNVASLLCTCRQIEREAAPIFYQLNDFVPYTALYLDKANLKDDHGFARDVPTWDQWATKSDEEKHDQLGIAAKHIGHIVSLVVYDDITRLNSSFQTPNPIVPSPRDREQANRCSKLLAEMLFWCRAKAPQVQCLSIRYPSHRVGCLESFKKGWVVSLPLTERRLYKAVRRFPHLRLLDLRRVYARPGVSYDWGDSAPLFELESHDARLKDLRGKVLGSALQRATTAKWAETAVNGLKCGIRWCLIMNPHLAISSVHHFRNRYTSEKIPPQSPFEYAWVWSLQATETWGRAQEDINIEGARGNMHMMLHLKSRPWSQVLAVRENGHMGTQPSGLWDRIWSLPAEVRTRVWQFSLKRQLPLHLCVEQNGDPCVGALLKVNRRARQECYRLFIKMNTFSMLPWLLPNPFTAAIVREDAFHAAAEMMSEGKFDLHQLPALGHIDALRSIHIDIWHSRYGWLGGIKPTIGYDRFIRLLHAAAPLLAKLSIGCYPTHQELSLPKALDYDWHWGIFETIKDFRHLKVLRILFALGDSLYFDVPWMQRLEEIDWSTTTPMYVHPEDGGRNSERGQPISDGLKGSHLFHLDPELKSFSPAIRTMEVADFFGERITHIRSHTWSQVGEKHGLEGFACRYDIEPRCQALWEEHECLPGPFDAREAVNCSK
jgi:hypothetical protein